MASPSLPTCGSREAYAWASDSAALVLRLLDETGSSTKGFFFKEVLDTRARRHASRALVRARGGAKLQQPGVKFQCISSTKLPSAKKKIPHECGKLPRLRLSRIQPGPAPPGQEYPARRFVSCTGRPLSASLAIARSPGGFIISFQYLGGPDDIDDHEASHLRIRRV